MKGHPKTASWEQHLNVLSFQSCSHKPVGGCTERGGNGKASEGSELDPEPPDAESHFTVWVKNSHGSLGLRSVTPCKMQFPVPWDEASLDWKFLSLNSVWVR